MDAWLKAIVSENCVEYGVPQTHVVSALERAGLATPEALVSTTSEEWGDATKLPPALLEKLQKEIFRVKPDVQAAAQLSAPPKRQQTDYEAAEEYWNVKADLSGWQDGLAAWGAMPGGDEPTEDEVENMFTSIGWADDGRDREGVIQLESAGIQLDGSPVHLDNTGMQVNGSGMHMDNAGMQMDASGMQMDGSGMQMDGSGMLMDSSGMQMQMDNMLMEGQEGYGDQVYMQQSAQQDPPVRYLQQNLQGQRSGGYPQQDRRASSQRNNLERALQGHNLQCSFNEAPAQKAGGTFCLEALLPP